jgi:hypothetical protein
MISGRSHLRDNLLKSPVKEDVLTKISQKRFMEEAISEKFS